MKYIDCPAQFPYAMSHRNRVYQDVFTGIKLKNGASNLVLIHGVSVLLVIITLVGV